MAIAREDVPDTIFEDLEEVRKSGLCNMLSFHCVTDALYNLDHSDTADWLVYHHKDYGTVVMRCFADWKAEQRG